MTLKDEVRDIVIRNSCTHCNIQMFAPHQGEIDTAQVDQATEAIMERMRERVNKAKKVCPKHRTIKEGQVLLSRCESCEYHDIRNQALEDLLTELGGK